MKLYHVTKREYLSSILEKGLIPYHSKGITCDIPKSYKQQPRVWLTDNIECYPEGLNKHISGEYVVFGIIPPTRINLKEKD